MSEHHGVVVTLADIYAAQQEQAVILAEIKGSLALQAQRDRNDEAKLTDHETRIRELKDAQANFITKAGAITLIVAIAAVISCIATVLGLVLA